MDLVGYGLSFKPYILGCLLYRFFCWQLYGLFHVCLGGGLLLEDVVDMEHKQFHMSYSWMFTRITIPKTNKSLLNISIPKGTDHLPVPSFFKRGSC